MTLSVLRIRYVVKSKWEAITVTALFSKAFLRVLLPVTHPQGSWHGVQDLSTTCVKRTTRKSLQKDSKFTKQAASTYIS